MGVSASGQDGSYGSGAQVQNPFGRGAPVAGMSRTARLQTECTDSGTLSGLFQEALATR